MTTTLTDAQLTTALQQLVAQGLTLRHVTSVLGKPTGSDPYAATAKIAIKTMGLEGRIEIDDSALFYKSHCGMFVNAWLHVPHVDANPDFKAWADEHEGLLDPSTLSQSELLAMFKLIGRLDAAPEHLNKAVIELLRMHGCPVDIDAITRESTARKLAFLAGENISADALLIELGLGHEVATSPQVGGTDSDAFADWFDGSIVADVGGQPFTVYGTLDGRDFLSCPGLGSVVSAQRQSPDDQPLFVSLKNPVRLRLPENLATFNDSLAFADAMTDFLLDSPDAISDAYEAASGATTPSGDPLFDFRAVLIKMGYDGIAFIDLAGGRHYIIFEPMQAKSAFHNNGEYSRNAMSVFK